MAHTYALVDDQGRQLDAHFSLEGGDIVMHSRGGTKGDGATNVDYTAGLHLILRRLNDGDVRVRAAWVDSVTVQALPLAERAILSADEGREPPERIHSLLTSRMKTVRSDPVSQAKGGNSTRRIRIQTSFPGASDEFAGLLKGIALEGDTRSRDRLPAETLNLATPEFVWAAVQRLLEGEVEHSFGPSTDFDLIADDGRRLPPKAIFGVALSLALGGASILPRHFTGGETSQCFRLLRAAGYQVVPKDTPAEPEETGEDIDADQEWIEGKKRLRVHRSRERGVGLARAKKAQFVREHGKLKCERCDFDPVAYYGTENGASCIEVHHARVQLGDMTEGHKTRLQDLQCLCANCHRLVHRIIATAR